MPPITHLLSAAFLFCSLGAAQAAEPAPSPAVAAFDRFVIGAVPVCLNQPAQKCVDSGWLFTDTNADGSISPAEATLVRAIMGDWLLWRQSTLTRQERSALALGLFVTDSIGIEQLMAGFDSDGNSLVTREELLADVTLDQRPIGQVLADPQAVDREAVARRLGAAAPLLDGVLR